MKQTRSLSPSKRFWKSLKRLVIDIVSLFLESCIHTYIHTYITIHKQLRLPVNFKQKRVSAELQLDAVNSKKEKETDASRAATAAEKIKNNPLLKYLREKSLRKQQEKKMHKER